MTLMLITRRSGERQVVEGKNGETVMEAMRGAGIDEVLALCGGNCACATCHVYVDAKFLHRLHVIGEPENDLLEGSGQRRAGSRLACQIVIADDLAGLEVAVAPEF